MSNIIYLTKPNRRCGSTTYFRNLAMKFGTAPIFVELQLPIWEDQGYAYNYERMVVSYYRFTYDNFRLGNPMEYDRFYKHLRQNKPPIFLLDHDRDNAVHRKIFDMFRQYGGLIFIEDATELTRKEEEQKRWFNYRQGYPYYSMMKDMPDKIIRIDYC